MADNKNDQHGYLSLMQDQIEKLIFEGRALNESTVIYETLKNIIDLRITERELTERFDEFSEVVIAMAQLDFSRRMHIENTKDLFAYVSTSLNLLNEELEVNTVPHSYLQSVLEMVPETMILTDEDGYIRFCNKAAQDMLGYTGEELLEKPVSSFYASEWLAKKLEDEEMTVKELPVNFLHKDETLVSVLLSVTPIEHPHKQVGGYRFYAKNKG